MGKNKLKKFAEMETFQNVFQCGARELGGRQPSEVSLQKHPMAGHWREQFFHNDKPIVLELGCGRGEYTVGLARKYPDRNFIGVDIKGARMWAGAKEATLDGLRNVAFLRTNIEIITAFFAPDEVDEIWITFCDPQMKKATKRLTSTWFMQRYQRIVRPGGLIHLKTDSPFLYTYTREMLRLNPYPVLADTDDLYACEQYPDAQSLKTHYERQWLDRGMRIKYLAWSLTPLASWEEPTVEIEHDTYRSYGRNYTTKPE
ncbi:MAG: tRNA (guanosine(46)-N7)-methyltransferase TrmB [Paludibacteraceae bacterium]|nr:tRNA (guanosine(46)-N7)-methyltransferase TrmB [Paludibacteraceae bacterium]